MDSRPFLTDLDERARVKGSRDPLGYMSIWGGFGRRVVGNLTNQTVSVRGFTTLLLAHWFAERLQDRHGVEAAPTLDVLLRFEQLAAYCRFLVNRDHSEFRGIRRVAARLSRGSRITIGAATEHQILSSQRMYGLWGLYSVAARVSGMLQEEPVLTPVSRDFVEGTYLRALHRQGADLADRISRVLLREEATLDLGGRDAALASAVAGLHAFTFDAAEREFYSYRLVEGAEQDRTAGMQRKLAALLRGVPQDVPFNMQQLRTLALSSGRDSDGRLHDELEHIRRVERILGPTSYVFGFVLTRDRKAVGEIAAEVQREWHDLLPTMSFEEVESLRDPLQQLTGDETTASRLLQMGVAMASGSYGDLVNLVLEQNAAVMASRDGSSPWAEVEAGRLKVRLRDETGHLPSAREVPEMMRHTYYIAPLKVIQTELDRIR